MTECVQRWVISPYEDRSANTGLRWQFARRAISRGRDRCSPGFQLHDKCNHMLPEPSHTQNTFLGKSQKFTFSLEDLVLHWWSSFIIQIRRKPSISYFPLRIPEYSGISGNFYSNLFWFRHVAYSCPWIQTVWKKHLMYFVHSAQTGSAAVHHAKLRSNLWVQLFFTS